MGRCAANALVIDGQLAAADVPAPTRGPGPRSRPSLRDGGSLARGRLLGAMGDLPAARRAFEESLALLDGCRCATTSRGSTSPSVRRFAGAASGVRPTRSSAPLVTSIYYLSLGAQTYVQRCERELKAGGLHPLRGPRGHVELTPAGGGGELAGRAGVVHPGGRGRASTSRRRPCSTTSPASAKLGVRSRAELGAARR